MNELMSKRKDKEMRNEFFKDHCWGWRPPMSLRKKRPYTSDEIEYLYQLREIDLEAGRKRMVARGLKQYAKPGEL
jgi:hypothetical protein